MSTTGAKRTGECGMVVAGNTRCRVNGCCRTNVYDADKS